MNLGMCKAEKDLPVGSFNARDSSDAIEGADKLVQPSSRCCDAIGLQIHPPKDAAAESRGTARAAVQSLWSKITADLEQNA